VDKCAYNDIEGGCDEIQERTLFAIVSIGAPGGSITSIATTEGWLYLALVLHVFSRKVVGWAMDE
jgi:transposase InsO family protein